MYLFFAIYRACYSKCTILPSSCPSWKSTLRPADLAHQYNSPNRSKRTTHTILGASSKNDCFKETQKHKLTLHHIQFGGHEQYSRAKTIRPTARQKWPMIMPPHRQVLSISYSHGSPQEVPTALHIDSRPSYHSKNSKASFRSTSNSSSFSEFPRAPPRCEPRVLLLYPLRLQPLSKVSLVGLHQVDTGGLDPEERQLLRCPCRTRSRAHSLTGPSQRLSGHPCADTLDSAPSSPARP